MIDPETRSRVINGRASINEASEFIAKLEAERDALIGKLGLAQGTLSDTLRLNAKLEAEREELSGRIDDLTGFLVAAQEGGGNGE